MSRKTQILVVEDEAAIQELLRYTLEQAGFEAVLAGSGEQALSKVRGELPDAVLIDLMLPGVSGMALAKQFRADPRTRDLPLLMVTARVDEADRVHGLESGADDYITKPFSPKELVARIRAVLRRRAPHQSGDAVESGDIRLDPATHVTTKAGREIALGPTEFALLQYLMTHPNRVHGRNQLLNALHGDHRFLEERTVDVYIRRLRVGLGEHGHSLIQTVRGVGYRFVAAP
jgi:two-component system phosphate regulon response regulator PhoB